MSWWAWVIAGAILLGAELAFVNAQFYLVFIGSAAIVVGLIRRWLRAFGVGAVGRCSRCWRSSPWWRFAVASTAGCAATRPRYAPDPPEACSRCASTSAPGESCQAEHGGTFWTVRNDSDTLLHPAPAPASRACTDSRCSFDPTPSNPRQDIPACTPPMSSSLSPSSP